MRLISQYSRWAPLLIVSSVFYLVSTNLLLLSTRQFSLSYADRIASLVLTNNGREAIKQHRKQVEDILAKEKEKERQVEAQNKRLEKKQKEKEDRASKSRDVQRKLEEKESKRDIKKRNRSMMKIQK